MAIIDEIKHNLQIGAPKLKSDADVIRAHTCATTVELPLRLRGGVNAEHVTMLTARLRVPMQDAHGHTAYGVHTTTTFTNDDQGWNLSPKEKLTLPLLFDLNLRDTATDQPLLIDVTAEVGRAVNNPTAYITLKVIRDAN